AVTEGRVGGATEGRVKKEQLGNRTMQGSSGKEGGSVQLQGTLNLDVLQATLFPRAMEEGVWPEGYTISDHAVLTRHRRVVATDDADGGAKATPSNSLGVKYGSGYNSAAPYVAAGVTAITIPPDVGAPQLALRSPHAGAKFWRKVLRSPGFKDMARKKAAQQRSMSFQQFDLLQLTRATRNFSKQNFIGKGSTSEVYRGAGPNGAQWAVKRSVWRPGGGDNGGMLTFRPANPAAYAELEADFIFGAKSMAVLCHQNVIQLLGYCFECGERVLIYEFVGGPSLESMIFGNTDVWKEKITMWRRGSRNARALKDLGVVAEGEEEGIPFDFMHRLLIAVDIAEAVAYLHTEFPRPYLLEGLHPKNIIFDTNGVPKVGNIGRMKVLMTRDITGGLSMLGGLPHAPTLAISGYIDPSFNITRKSSPPNDVYAFGVILLQIFTGRPAVIENEPGETTAKLDLGTWVSKRLRKVAERLLAIHEELVKEGGVVVVDIPEPEPEAGDFVVGEEEGGKVSGGGEKLGEGMAEASGEVMREGVVEVSREEMGEGATDVSGEAMREGVVEDSREEKGKGGTDVSGEEMGEATGKAEREGGSEQESEVRIRKEDAGEKGSVGGAGDSSEEGRGVEKAEDQKKGKKGKKEKREKKDKEKKRKEDEQADREQVEFASPRYLSPPIPHAFLSNHPSSLPSPLPSHRLSSPVAFPLPSPFLSRCPSSPVAFLSRRPSFSPVALLPSPFLLSRRPSDSPVGFLSRRPSYSPVALPTLPSSFYPVALPTLPSPFISPLAGSSLPSPILSPVAYSLSRRSSSLPSPFISPAPSPTSAPSRSPRNACPSPRRPVIVGPSRFSLAASLSPSHMPSLFSSLLAAPSSPPSHYLARCPLSPHHPFSLSSYHPSYHPHTLPSHRPSPSHHPFSLPPHHPPRRRPPRLKSPFLSPLASPTS
ncbi:unnamed protein product, partial [Closterium sp. Naga37s-1]